MGFIGQSIMFLLKNTKACDVQAFGEICKGFCINNLTNPHFEFSLKAIGITIQTLTGLPF